MECISLFAWHVLFLYFVSQCMHSCIEPSLHGLDFFLEIFLWRLVLLNITCDCSGCLSVSSTTCSASCFMWFEERGGHSRLVLIRNIAADSSGYLLLSDLTQQTCHGNYSPSQDELMCCKSKAPASECVSTCRVDSMP